MVWRLQRVLPQVPSTDSESSWEDRWCLSPLPPGHLQHPSHPQSPQHCRWSHPPVTQLLQSAAIREETAESPSQDQQTEGQLHPPGCQEAELPPVLAPLPSLLPHTLLNSDTTTPPPLTNCDPHQSLCAALDWSLPHPALSVNYLFWQSDKRLFFFCTTHICTVLFLFNWFALYLPCALCHFIYLFFIFIFLQCPHLYICIVCMYIWLNCIYLYLNVYCQCLMLTVCTKGQRVTQFQFSVCMYCTCGRIDNKADLTWLEKVNFWRISWPLFFHFRFKNWAL